MLENLMSFNFEAALGRSFFLAYSGLVYAAGRKKSEKKHTEHERVQFLGTTEHERGPFHARHTAKNTH